MVRVLALAILSGCANFILNIQLVKGATPSHKLNWSHYVEFLKIDDPLERSFYEKQSILETWNIRELKRQMKTSLFLQLAATKDKEGVLQLAKQGQII